VTWTATIVGGPEDGRTFAGPGDVPPPVLIVAVPGPMTSAALASSEPTIESAAFDTVRLYRARYDDGRWLFVWPAGPTP
jgi:hypothetical protein